MHDDARCRSCGYSLRGLAGSACPECGSVYDGADPTTFRMADRGARWREFRIRIENIQSGEIGADIWKAVWVVMGGLFWRALWLPLGNYVAYALACILALRIAAAVITIARVLVTGRLLPTGKASVPPVRLALVPLTLLGAICITFDFGGSLMLTLTRSWVLADAHQMWAVDPAAKWDRRISSEPDRYRWLGPFLIDKVEVTGSGVRAHVAGAGTISIWADPSAGDALRSEIDWSR